MKSGHIRFIRRYLTFRFLISELFQDKMKSIMLISLAFLVIQMAQGDELICHPATLSDDVWAKTEYCCLGDCADKDNWHVFEGYEDFANNCPGKCQEAQCTKRSIARIDGGNEVFTWTAEDEFNANGAPVLAFNI